MEKLVTVKELNSKQWELYNFLKMKNDFVSMEEIKNSLSYESSRMVRYDVRNLRASDVIKKVIINDYKNGYKIARTEEEGKEYLDKKEKKILKEIELLNHERKQLGLNGQMVIQFTGYEKDTVESIEKR